MSAKKPELRAILSEDGEFQEIEDRAEELTPEARLSAVFCTNCGTANPSTGHYCRSCGQSLEEQTVQAGSLDNYAPPLRKGKRDLSAAHPGVQERPAPTNLQVIATTFMDVVTLLVMGGLVFWTVHAGQGLVAVVIIVCWLFIEAARHGWKLD